MGTELTYAPSKLLEELNAAGVPAVGCSADGRIDFGPEATFEDRLRAAAIVEAHDPSPTRAELLRELGMTEREAALAIHAVDGEKSPSWVHDVLLELATRAKAALAVLLLVLVLVPGCGSSGAGSLQDGGAWLAPSSQRFERTLEPHTAANPTPVTVTVVVQGGGGGEAIGKAVDTFLPGWGWIVGGVASTVGAAFAGKRAAEGKLGGDLATMTGAVTTLMGGLELAPPAVRTAVRDRARQMGLSHVLERMIAQGQVRHVSIEDPRDPSRAPGATPIPPNAESAQGSGNTQMRHSLTSGESQQHPAG